MSDHSYMFIVWSVYSIIWQMLKLIANSSLNLKLSHKIMFILVNTPLFFVAQWIGSLYLWEFWKGNYTPFIFSFAKDLLIPVGQISAFFTITTYFILME